MTRAKHLGLWLSAGGGLLASVAAAASLLLIAPGVSVAGRPVGLTTQGIAEQDIGDRLAHAQVRVGDEVLTGAELGASVDAHSLARDAAASHPLWNVTAWNPAPTRASVSIDPAVAVPALRAAAPQLFADAVDARVVFDKTKQSFAAVPGRPGSGVDLDDLASRLGTALTGGAASVSVTPTSTITEPTATTKAAEAFATRLNAQADAAGFYVEGERVQAVSLTAVASWFTIATDPHTGRFTITPDPAAITAAVTDLAAKVDRAPQNELVVTNSAGKHLRSIQEGRAGFRLAKATSADGADTADPAAVVSSALSNGELRFTLQGDVLPFRTTTIFRRIEVDKSAGATYLYEGPASGQEKLVARYPVAIGTGGVHETRDGHFTVYAQLTSQNMGDCDGDHGFGYCTMNVPWVSYFNGDQGFHGTYWHNNFGPGARMSHGCVNMRIADAEALYRFAQVGTDVWVHD